MKSSLNRLALIALAPFSLASTSLGIDSKFETALKWEIYSNHQRHTPKVTISGDEVKLTYIHGEQWTKDSAHDDTAKFDVLTWPDPADWTGLNCSSASFGWCFLVVLSIESGQQTGVQTYP